MNATKSKRILSMLLSFVMILTMVPTAIFMSAAEDIYPVMKAFNAASGDDFHKYYRQVYSVTFLDEIDTDAMNGALEKWDLSAAGDESVWGWMYLNEEATAAAGADRYDVYVAGDGGVAAHEDTTHMFYVFQALKEVKGMEHFYTGNVKSFLYWFGNCNELDTIDLRYLNTSSATTLQLCFYACYKLKEVDASTWDVSKVTTLENMFRRCYSLETANLSGWNTKNVTNMIGVFDMNPPYGTSPDYSLKNVDLSGWDTSNVTTMENMFRNCEALETLDISSFDTSKVTTMRFMFYYCKNLKNIYAGEGWTTEAIANINDGIFNCCYALVGQTDDQDQNIDIYNEKHPSAYYPPAVEYAKFREDGGYLDNASNKPQAPQYTVTYKFIGDIIPDGVTAPADATYEEGTTVAREDNPSAEHYIFSGWSTDDATVDTDGNFVINNDVEFVGSWTKLYKVEYKYDENYAVPDGAPEIPETEFWYAPGEDVPVYGIPYVSEYIFVGWDTDDAEIIGDGFTMPENDVTIYGYFKKPVESVEILGGEITLDKDDTEGTKLNVYVKPEDATIKDIIYESSDESVVKVDENGVITPVGVGTATVTVKSEDDPTKSDTVTVTVKTFVKDIEVDKTEITLNKDNTDKITANVTPDDATNKEVVYESGDETIAKVDENGNIIAVGEGTTTITVSSKDNPDVKKEVTVTVKIPVTELKATEDFTLNIGEEKNVDAKVNEDATDKTLFYESSNPGVVKIDNDGNVIAVGEGEAVITITSKDDPTIKETVVITVKTPVEDVIVNKNDITLNVGENEEITTTVTPDNATNKEVTYESSDETVVTVDENGKITAVGGGTATVTVTSKDDPSKKEIITVTVNVPVKDITVDKTNVTIYKDGTDKITATVTPDNASNKELTYTSDDESIAIVDENGNITAVGEGTTTITVTSKDDPTVTETVVVTVKIPVEGVVVDKNDIKLDVGENESITVTVTPDGATNKDVTFESSDDSVVTVDENGNIIAIGEGTATITVTSKDDPSKKETVTVTVTVPVTDITVDKTTITLDKGKTDKITATVTPDNATDKKLTYTSNDESVVTVDESGNITAVGGGTTTIIVTSKDDPTVQETVTVTVNVPVEDVVVDDSNITLEVGENEKITVTVTPDDATDKNVTYESSDETIATVDEHGNVTAIVEGTVTITVTSKDDTSKKVTVNITVTAKAPEEPEIPEEPEKPEFIIEVPGEISIFEGETKNIGVNVTPDSGYPKPTYTSSDESVVTVDADGNIKGIKAGLATITVDFGNGEIRTVAIIVLAPPAIPTKHHICFGKTDGIGWYEVSINGGDFFPQGPNSTLEVEDGAILVVRVQDMWIDDNFTFYVNGKKVPMDAANTIILQVDGYMLIGALSMDTDVPDVEESVNWLQRILNAIRDFFQTIIGWFK